MKKFKFAGAFAAAALVMGMASAASAVTYDLNQSAAFPNGVTYGVVTLTQNGANVDVNVTLSAGFNFVRTGGPHDSFAFNTNDPSFGVTGINLSGWTSFTGGSNPAFGNFSIGMECTQAGCSNGGAGQQAGPLTFSVTNTTLANFVNNSSGYIFSADIIGNGITGAVGNGVPGGPGVPEPATWAMMILGMGMVGAGLRMRRRSVLTPA